MVFLRTKEGYVYRMLSNQILEKAHGSRYFIHPGATKTYNDLRELYWWDGLKGTL